MTQNHMPIVQPAQVNVAILTYNALEYTKLCLESISQRTKAPHNIFVLDNGSTDGSREWLRAYSKPNFFYTEASANLGVPGGRNELIRKIAPSLPSDGFVVFLDNDMEVLEGWDQQFLGFFGDHPEAGIASAFGHRMVVYSSHRELLAAPAYTAPVDVACGGFACWVRSAVLQAGVRFDEKLGIFWHEDDDFSVCALKAGFDVYALPHARVVHHEHKSGAANPGIKSGGSPKNQAYLCQKWRAMGMVDSEGRIIRSRKSRGGFQLSDGTKRLLNEGGYYWLPRNAALAVPSQGADGNNRVSLSLTLRCAKKEWYGAFPLSVEVQTNSNPLLRLTFSASDEAQPVHFQAAAGEKVSFRATSSFSPVLCGLGASFCEPVSLQLEGWPQAESPVIAHQRPSNPDTAVALFSAIFDTDATALCADHLISHLTPGARESAVRPESVNEDILKDAQADRDWMRMWQDCLARTSRSALSVVVGPPRSPDGRIRYAGVREQESGSSAVVGFLTPAPADEVASWVDALREPDEIWTPSANLRVNLIKLGVPEERIKLCPLPVHPAFLAESSVQRGIDGKFCFHARVRSFDDPFLRIAVAGYIAAFKAHDNVCLLVSLRPMGGCLNGEIVSALLGNPDLKDRELPLILTASPCVPPGSRAQLLRAVHCDLIYPDSRSYYELIESTLCGAPVLQVNSSGECERIVYDPIGDRGLPDSFYSRQTLDGPELSEQSIQTFAEHMLRFYHSHQAALEEASKHAAVCCQKVRDNRVQEWMGERLRRPEKKAETRETSIIETDSEVAIPVSDAVITVGIDARTLTYAETRDRGIGHYTYSHLSEIFRQRPNWKFVLYVDEGESSEPLSKLLNNGNVRRGVIGEQTRDNLDLYHIADPMTILQGFDSPFLMAPDCPRSAVFYDLIPLVKREMHFDRWEEWRKRWYMRRLQELSRSEAEIFAISESTRSDLHRFTGYPLERITAIMAGLNASSATSPSTEAVDLIKAKFNLQAPYFMSVGGLDGHKGFHATAQAYAALAASRPAHLVIVGSLNDPYKDMYRKLFAENNVQGVVFTGYVSREEMDCLYSGATALVYPSHYEGFGFPVLEAMAKGCPVITTKVSSLPEVSGSAAMLVEVDDVRAIAEAMNSLTNDPSLRNRFSENGITQAKKFSWKNTAAKTISCWERQLGISSAPLGNTTVSQRAPNPLN